jgi:hypothetical protein
MPADTPLAVRRRYFAKCLANMLMLRLISLVLVSADEDGRIIYFHPALALLREAWNQPPGTEHDDLEQ